MVQEKKGQCNAFLAYQRYSHWYKKDHQKSFAISSGLLKEHTRNFQVLNVYVIDFQTPLSKKVHFEKFQGIQVVLFPHKNNKITSFIQQNFAGPKAAIRWPVVSLFSHLC